VREFVNVSGGVTFSDVYPPDAPADKAGLVGGDIINSFDGKPVRNRDEMRDLLRQTPVAKTVEVTYVRDGETKQTKLSTISPEQLEQLVSNFEDRPAGHGQLGFEDTETVAIEGSRISGVRLNALSASGPAALAGIQKGDIVIAWDGVPIRNRGEFLTRVRRAIPYSTVNVVVMRASQRLEIPVKIGKR
jgi:serine protease Do